MRNLEKLKLSIYYALIIILFVKCANIKSPSGGPPDTIPPRVVESYPTDRTLNFKDNKVSIYFSEWVERGSVMQNIAISPPIEYSLKWSGKKLDIRFLEVLKPNTTYSFMLGTDYTDTKSNKPDSAFGITFSTGSVIDSGTISGRIIGKDAASTYIYGYRIDNKNPDTLNYEEAKAEYSTQVGNNGQFTLRALPDGLYRIIAVKTSFRDNLFHPAQDQFGTTTSDVQIIEGHSFPQIIKINKYPNLFKADIVKIIQLDSNLLNIEFTKQIASQSFSIEQFQILDTITNNNIPIQAVWLDSLISNKLSVLTSTGFIVNRPYKFQIMDSTLKDIYDISLFGIEKEFYAKGGEFKFVPQLISAPFQDSTRNIGFESEYTFIFNYPFQIDSNSNAIELIQFPDSSKVRITIEQLSLNILQVKPLALIAADTWYRYYLNVKELQGLYSRKFQDTIVRLSFKTDDWRPNPTISGKITKGIPCPNIFVILKDSKDDEARVTKADSLGNWQIDYVRPDTYTIEVFCDENGNGKYDYGLAKPYRYSELFENYEQKIEVKPRWNIEKINITFPTHFQFIK